MRLLITGAGGMLAQALRRELLARGHEVVALDRAALDITDAAAVASAIGAHRPEAVIQCAAYTRVDDAEREEDAAHRVNAEATGHLARACRAAGARLIYPSTDYVFDGRATSPYTPAAPTNPIGAYGRSKLAGELAAREAEDFLVVRTSWLYGAGGKNFVATILERARRGEALRVVADQYGSPTWTGSLARTIAELIERQAPAGVYHATNRGETTWHGLATEALRVAGVEAEITPVTTAEFPRPAPRPAYSVLDCTATEAVVGELAEWRESLAEALATPSIEQ
jgi:dTDP-4-dehydrorhamnose reductase